MPNSARAITVRPTGGVTPDMEKFIVNYLNKKAEFWIYTAEMQGDARHLHIGAVPYMKVSPDNLAGKLWEALFKTYGEVFEIRKRCVKNVSWYAPDPEFFARNPHFEVKAEDWVKYLTKENDGEGIKSASWDWSLVESELCANKADDVRMNKKHWYLKTTMDMFKDYKLPTATYEQIKDGLHQLCFEENVTKYPDRNREHEYVADIWCAHNKGKRRDVVMRELDMMRFEEREIDRAIKKEKKRRIRIRVQQDFGNKRIRSDSLESLSSFLDRNPAPRS